MEEFKNVQKLANEIARANMNAYFMYEPIINNMLCYIVSEENFNDTLDKFVEFCGYERNENLFKDVCNQYSAIYPEAVEFHRKQLQELFYE